MPRTRAIVVGTGGFARSHLRAMVAMKRQTEIVGFVEVSEASRDRTSGFMQELGAPCPPFYETIQDLIRAQGAPDAAIICTPHKFHYENAADLLKAGTDVCIEKPMVMNAAEARRLIKLRDKTEKLVMVGFPGSLSPAIHKAKALITKGVIGRVSGISAFSHQNWKVLTTGLWRQIPEISGGGFLFDTGSHMVNTVVDLIGEDITRVSALLDNAGTPVEINSSVSARSRSGVMISLAGAGDSMQCCSLVTVFGDKGVLQTGIYGERLRMKKVKESEFKDIAYPKSRGVWEQFLKVRDGKLENPCPPEVGLRFAKLMDMIRKSAETGKVVKGS